MLCTAACHTPLNNQPTIHAIEPATGIAGEDTPVTILGDNFSVRPKITFGDDGSNVDARYTITLGGAPVDAAGLVNRMTLMGLVPGTLALGAHDLVIRDPAGRTAMLPAAFVVIPCAPANADVDGDGRASIACGGDDCDDSSRLCTSVCEDLDGDADFDCRDHCIDVDGDGTGRGHLGNAGCLDPLIDSDDDDGTRCGDTDGDGCDDCNNGLWDPANDGDGVCDFIPPAAVVIGGSGTVGTDATMITVPINPPVDPVRSLLFFNVAHDGQSPDEGQLMGTLAGDGASITFSRESAGSHGVDISWVILEHEALTVQRGVAALAVQSVTSPTDLTLTTPVDPTRTFVLSSLATDGGTFSRNDWAATELTDSTTLSVRRGDGGSPADLSWQVAEIASTENVVVQHGVTNLMSGTAGQTVSMSAPAPRNRSFLLFTHVETSSGTNTTAHQVVRGTLQPGDEIRFERDGTDNDIRVSWTVVRWQSIAAQHGEVTFGTSELEQTVTLSTAVDPAVSVPFLPSLQREGSTPHASNDDIGVAWFTSELISAGTELRLRRGSGASPATASWTVIELR